MASERENLRRMVYTARAKVVDELFRVEQALTAEAEQEEDERTFHRQLYEAHLAGYEFSHAVNVEGYLLMLPDGTTVREPTGRTKVFPDLKAAVRAAEEHDRKGRDDE